MTERELFLQALDVASDAERAAFLNRACGGDVALRRRIEGLLLAHEQAGGFLAQPHPAAEAEPTGAYVARATVAAGKPGSLIAGKYKLLEPIGEGGMGAVWRAEQREPIRRQVAVKLIRAEREGSAMILSRFEAERQAIALMDHPNIAKLLDAGAAETGAPFFVMELVRGKSLTEFCDEHRLSVPARLDLFVQICSAVQHAHQKGIIHRDLKPTNILVELHDDKPVPKVIDFGLAKAMSGQALTERTLFTGFGAVAGTPLYMAPEQAKFNAVDVDTRADVYALGVILYELLTGSTPIERAVFKQAALDEMLRVIRESEPPAPSKRLSTADGSPSVGSYAASSTGSS
jgi:serine/threonine protein kinase